ncbi:HopJ type III effector protein [Moraxella nasibovis]|uniref:HopJ type III effector protein n=1 Tax=Moraxella nasibovis TaxID=2904120 RepID=UPI00240F1F89|nr:HopJ type III effector protein [Moraxella nasibovis]WFF37747.1 HopJ type III effector protein [Moraxella nasibovis]
MTSQISALLNGIETGALKFADVISFIDSHHSYTPTEFHNGEVVNPAGINEGSAKVFSLAKLHGLNQLDTLKLFAEHYHSVLATPNGTDHANIRNFMHYGWQGFHMAKNALSPR